MNYNDFKDKLAEKLDLPKEVLINLPLITLTGDLALSVENFKGIIRYEVDSIVLNSSIGEIEILGENLFIKYLVSDEVRVEGKVKKIIFKD
ncbi:MAG: sporulation protein YqfC [Thermovenabulum sp.]|uniref:sporulation protein YqfC n=1 Tax=Thermovenabulum sp. TaxID=3100335 RepID=UPI003C7B61AE